MLVLGQKERCGDWAKAKIPGVQSWGEWYEAIGWEKDGELQAVAIFDHYSGPDISIHVAAVPGRRWMTREALRTVFRYPFNQLGVHRVTGCIASRNKDAVRLNLHLGFTLEGVKRQGSHDGDDMLILGMLKEECRWL